MKKLLFPLVFALYVFPPAVTAQVRCGMVTEPLETPDEFGQRAFLTYRAGDPYATDIPRNTKWRSVDRSKYRYVWSSFYFMDNLKWAFGKSLPAENLSTLFQLEPKRKNEMGLVFTVNDDGRILSVVFEYPDIPAYTSIPPRCWRKLERNIRKRVFFEYSNPLRETSPALCREVRLFTLHEIFTYHDMSL